MALDSLFHNFIPPTLTHHVYAVMGYGFGEFEEISGGEYVQERQPYAEAGSMGLFKLRGRYQVNDIVLRRIYRQEFDQSVIQWAKLWIEGDTNAFPVTVTRIVERYNVSRLRFVQDMELYPNCKCVSLAYPDGKSGENAPAMLTLVLTRDT